MGRAIDADDLMKAMYHRAFEADGDTMWQSGCWMRYKAIEQVVKGQPTIEPERKTGKWIDKSGGIEGAWNYCSVCGEQAIDLFDFCPNCGADMREGEQE